MMLEEGKSSAEALALARGLGREFVVEAKGVVVERLSKNDKMPTGDIEIKVKELRVLNPAKLPPFLIEDETDGGDDIRMKYRYLELSKMIDHALLSPALDLGVVDHQRASVRMSYFMAANDPT